MVGGRTVTYAGLALVCLGALLSACTLSAGSDTGPSEQVITATLSVTQPATLAAVIQASIATYTPTNPPVLAVEATAPATSTPAYPASPTHMAMATATPTLTSTPESTIPATPTPVMTIALDSTESTTNAENTVSDADIDATVVRRLEATNAAHTATADALPSATPTTTLTPTATITPPPSLTPLSTAIPPTRTHPGPPTVIPFDDGSGDLIPGTGGTTSTTFSPIPGLDALPHTLYYLSDAGTVRQVFRLQIGLPYPEQLTYSPTGVLSFDVAPDATLAYITGEGDMVIGGLPFLPPANPDGTVPEVTALAWSPDGGQLAYTLYTLAAWNVFGEHPTDGLWLRNTTSGITNRLKSNLYEDDETARSFQGALSWRPDGTEILARGIFGTTESYSRVKVATSTVELVPFTEERNAVYPVTACWSSAGNAIIVSGGGSILSIDPDTGTSQTLYTSNESELYPREAQQFEGGMMIFANLNDLGIAQLYAIPAESNAPVAITGSLTDMGVKIDYITANNGQQLLVTAHEVGQSLGTAFLREANGNLIDLTPLTGLVGAPQWGPTFKKNDQARVHIEGEPLNVRATPGGEWLASLTDGVPVTIIDGLVEQDGYTWWQIRVANGVTGWSVESVTDDDGARLQTLQPVPK